MTEKKRKALYWAFKLAGIIVSCSLPLWAILERFPLWTYTYGTVRSVGVGLILSLIVLLIIFRRTVFDFMRDKLNLKHAPPLVVWLVMLVVSYVLVYIGNFMRDLTTVLWMGLIGCAIGTFLTYISERCGKEKPHEQS
jgi:amino acid transporter